MCHLSCVTCHVSPITCHLSHITSHPEYSGISLWLVPLAQGASYFINSLVTVRNYVTSTELAKNWLQWVIQESFLGNKFPV